MGRFLLLIFVISLSVGIPVICGFPFIEALIIFFLAIFWLGFFGWAMENSTLVWSDACFFGFFQKY
jgi:hypothetical protein